MSDLINNKKFNLPVYINIPLFLYQDSRLEKSSTLIAAFFYSIHTSGGQIIASTDYLCELAGIHKRQLYKVMNALEEYKYITREGFTNRKKIHWIYDPKSTLTVIDKDTSALKDTSVQEQNTSALQCTKLVHSTTLNLCTPVHTYNKEDNKDYKTTTTEPPPVKPDENPSSSFFSEKQTKEFLDLKIKSDKRTDEEFIDNCRKHIEQQNNEHTRYQRIVGLRNLLIKMSDLNEPFKAKGYYPSGEELKKQKQKSDMPTQFDFCEYRARVKGYEWVGEWISKKELEKERNEPGYISKFLDENPEMRLKNAS